ncbi:hypothetical protein B0H21DRAFT_740017 [Amylocystis lapponica]|nr:hypothetical protein B0H21DRAFT_740017 [Amylocystis lapponica]
MFPNKLPLHDPARTHIPLMSRDPPPERAHSVSPSSPRYPSHPPHDIPSVPPQYHLHPSQSTPFNHPTPSANPNAAKRKHICPTCDRGFTTSGHLARHTRVHTGERNHKCPFPGCETRCSRQDNLQQHYRIHLSPGSRRSSASATRAAMTRAMGSSDPSRPGKRDNHRIRGNSMAVPTPPESPPLEPPPLAPAYARAPPVALPEPPDTPPPLEQAPLPALLASASYPHPPSGSVSSRSSADSTPDVAYRSPHTAVPQLYSGTHSVLHSPELSYPSSQSSHASSGSGHNGSQSLQWDYRGHPGTSYEDDVQGSYSHSTDTGYRNTNTPPSPTASVGSQYRGQAQEVPEPYLYSPHYELQYPDTAQMSQHPTSPTSSMPTQYQYQTHAGSHEQPRQHNSVASTTSRHSIAHISHPYSNPSPVSSASQSPTTSHPPTPVYPTTSMGQFHNEYTAVPPQHTYSHSYSNTQPYHSGDGSRYHSPPPILAPIHNERVVRGELEQAVRHPGPQHASAGHHPHSHYYDSHAHRMSQGSDPGSSDESRVPTPNHYPQLHQPQPQHPSHVHEPYIAPYASDSSGYYTAPSWRTEEVRGRDGLVQ